MFALLQLCDSLFPIGAFSHSDGLEAATDAGFVQDAAALEVWIDACLHESLAKCDGPAVARAWNLAAASRWNDLAALDAEVHAMRPSSTGRQASRAMGSRLVRTWQHIRPSAALADAIVHTRAELTLPVAFGAVCAASGVEARAAVEGYFYTRLASIVSSAMRLMPIGQHEAHTLLSGALARAPRLVDEALRNGDGPSMFAPALDIVAMSQQHVVSRLFRS